HIHCISHFIGRQGMFEFCATTNRAVGEMPANFCSDSLQMSNIEGSQVKVTVLVNVRQFREKPENVANSEQSIPSVVRLHPLNECKRWLSNAGKDVFKTVVNGRILRSVDPQGEATVLFPVNRQGDTGRIEFDEIESQIIERGSDLIKDFSSQDADFGRRG